MYLLSSSIVYYKLDIDFTYFTPVFLFLSDKIFELFILQLTHRNIFDPIQCTFGNLKLPPKSNSDCIFSIFFLLFYLFTSSANVMQLQRIGLRST